MRPTENTPRPSYCPAKKDHARLLLLRLAGNPHDDMPARLQPKAPELEALEQLSHLWNDLWSLLPRIQAAARANNLLGELSETVRFQLKRKTNEIIATHLFSEHSLTRIIEQLLHWNIPAILLKSAAFNSTLYTPDAPRPGRDLDLLVREQHFEQACRILEKTMMPLVLDPRRRFTHRSLFERVFRPREGTGPTVEIHKGLTNPGIFDIEEKSLWEASRPHPNYPGEQVRILSAEHNLLHLAVHAFRDLNFCTHNLLDTHEIVVQWSPDPETLMKEARRWGAGNALHCLLENCKAVMGTPLKNGLAEQLAPGIIRRKAMQAILRSRKSLATRQENKNMGYRILQLAAQAAFPDHPRQMLRHQLSYLRLRTGDLLERE